MTNAQTAAKLPEIDRSATSFEALAGQSVQVLVRVSGMQGVHMARYYHESGRWVVSFLHGEWSVIEWWPMPEYGTGTEVAK